MSNVIKLIPASDGPRVDSREIAKSLGSDHRSTFRLITRYRNRFERFGLLRFEIAAVKAPGARGVKHHQFAQLNEDQCYFLLSLSRNTDRVVDLKADLVAEFARARRAGFESRISIIEELARLDALEAGSKAKGSIGSKLMNGRKADIREITPIRIALEASLQPKLPFAA